MNGVAFGSGCQMALMGDIVVCSEDAVFGLPELRIGLIPGLGGTQRLARIAGKVNAMRYILTSDSITAQRAYELGMVSDIFPREQLHLKTLDMARVISEKSMRSLVNAKKLIKEADELSLEDGVRLERKHFYPLFNSEATKEGIKAFLEKRDPVNVEETTTEEE